MQSRKSTFSFLNLENVTKPRRQEIEKESHEILVRLGEINKQKFKINNIKIQRWKLLR